MEKELLDKEVLCMFDTRQIQQFMFHAATLRDSIGGSVLLSRILPDAIEYALKNIDTPLDEDEYDLSLDPDEENMMYFQSDRVKFQYVFAAAGNALCLFKTGELCRNVIRKVSRYYLEHGYSLNLAAAAVLKTEDMGRDVFELYKKLARIKASCDVLSPMGALPIVMKEDVTGEPVIGFDEKNGDYVSQASVLRRQYASVRGDYTDYRDITASQSWDGKKYKAVIHADGNNFGISVGRILQTSNSYEEGIRIRRRISINIESVISRAVEDTIDDLKKLYTARGGNEEMFSTEFLLMQRAGDDINICCNAMLAFPFVMYLFKHLEGKMLWDSPSLKLPFYICAGIAFVTPKYNFKRAFDLAESCCDNAKKTAKKQENLVNGFAYNWMDFQVSDNPQDQELDTLREQSYITDDNIDLLLRPYCMDPSYVNSFDSLCTKMCEYRKLHLNHEQAKMMHRSYAVGKEMFTRWIRSIPELDLTGKLGDPLFREGDKRAKAAWFDAVEASDFIPEDGEILL